MPRLNSALATAGPTSPSPFPQVENFVGLATMEKGYGYKVGLRGVLGVCLEQCAQLPTARTKLESGQSV